MTVHESCDASHPYVVHPPPSACVSTLISVMIIYTFEVGYHLLVCQKLGHLLGLILGPLSMANVSIAYNE